MVPVEAVIRSLIAKSSAPSVQMVPLYTLMRLLAVVRRLLAPRLDTESSEHFIARHLRDAWKQTRGNPRETLFQLYDCWEAEMCVSPITPRGTL